MIRRLFLVVAAVGLVATGCGSSSDAADDANLPPDDPGVTPDGTIELDEPTTTAPSTTQPPPEEAIEIPDLRIDLVEFGDLGFVQITNTGTTDADISGIFFCQFPTYVDLAQVVESGTIPAGGVLQLDATIAGGLSIDGGEAALYSNPDFANPEAIFAFVQWGTGGARGGVAADAGLWPDAATVVTPDPQFGAIELFGDPADPASWG